METIKISPFKIKFNNSFLNLFFILIILQIVLGAFLAGMDGGLIYNSWPDMNGNFLPNDINNINTSTRINIVKKSMKKIALMLSVKF